MTRSSSVGAGGHEVASLGDEELRALFEGAEVLERTANGEPKVALTPSNRIVKRISRKPCGGALDRTPRALRFASNCERLRALGIRVPTVESIHSLGPGRNDVLVHLPVEGESLRTAAEDPRRRAALLRTFASTLASHLAAEGGLRALFESYAEAAGLGRMRAGIVAAPAKAAYPHVKTAWSAPAGAALAVGP